MSSCGSAHDCDISSMHQSHVWQPMGHLTQGKMLRAQLSALHQYCSSCPPGRNIGMQGMQQYV